MSAINLYDSSDDDIPSGSGLTFSSTNRASSASMATSSSTAQLPVAAASAAAAALHNSSNKRPAVAATAAAAAKPKKAPKLKKSEQPHCLIWVCTHGKGQSRSWRNKDLKLVGVYSSKAAAENAKRNVMAQHECCGHGDILVGGCWDDEIDLVVREAPMFLDE